MGLRHLRQHIRAAEAAAGEPSTSLRQLYKDMLQLKRLGGGGGVAPWLLALGVDKISTHILSVLTNIKSNQDRIQALETGLHALLLQVESLVDKLLTSTE